MGQGCTGDKPAIYTGNLTITINFNQPVTNTSKVQSGATLQIEKTAHHEFQISIPGCSALSRSSDEIGFEILPGQLCSVDLSDGTRCEVELEGTAQVHKSGDIYLLCIGRHSHGESTWEFIGQRARLKE